MLKILLSNKFLVYNSVEKTAGSTVKKNLIKNFYFSKKINFYLDYDLGDYPGENLSFYSKELSIPNDDWDTTSKEFRYKRGEYIYNNFFISKIKCIYGHGLNYNFPLLDKLYEKFKNRMILVTCMRDPVTRILSEYNYTKYKNLNHSLHQVAKSSLSFQEYIKHPERPKNRFCNSIERNENKKDYLNIIINKLKLYTILDFNNFDNDFCNFTKKQWGSFLKLKENVSDIKNNNITNEEINLIKKFDEYDFKIYQLFRSQKL